MLLPAMAVAVGACSNRGSLSSSADGGAGHGPAGAAGTHGTGGTSQGSGGASGSNGAAGSAAGSGGAGAGGSGAGGAAGQSANFVTFAFTGHVTRVEGVLTADTTPQVGDPFTGSYTFDASAAPEPNGTGTGAAFIETKPGIAANLEIHTLSYSFPSPAPPPGSYPYLLISVMPGAYNLTISPFGVSAALGDDSPHMDLYWMLTTDPSAGVPSTQKLSTVPPVLSSTQMAGAVSIELKATLHSDYVALGVIDTIVVR